MQSTVDWKSGRGGATDSRRTKTGKRPELSTCHAADRLPAVLRAIQDFTKQDRLLDAAGPLQHLQDLMQRPFRVFASVRAAALFGILLRLGLAASGLRVLRSRLALLPRFRHLQPFRFSGNLGDQRLFDNFRNLNWLGDAFTPTVGVLWSGPSLRLLLLFRFGAAAFGGAAKKVFQVSRHRSVPG